MPMKPTSGNMYPWVTHTHAHLGGECSHRCCYCYVDNPRFGRAPRYQGGLRIIPGELKIKYGSGKTIFIEHMNDLFAEAVPMELIDVILSHCREWPDNTYVFQTKNPARMAAIPLHWWPYNLIIGTTIETNRPFTSAISNAPSIEERAYAMKMLAGRKFITVEPILEFDVTELTTMIVGAKPEWVNIGADSKNHGLPEPSYQKVEALIRALGSGGIEVREKRNLERLKYCQINT